MKRKGTRRQHENTKALFDSIELANDYRLRKAMEELDQIIPPVTERTRLRHIIDAPGVFDAGAKSNPELWNDMDYEP